ncbi:MAG: hypothetical protein DI542_17305 [Acinetobacter johnsonii]|jgi:hypothetical protein|uniref:Uncharacterized protein n=1 Tax=Acinetobacter johnsonii TaxID=40214 RepID=A0A2W5SZ26_ACIJO|nr:hypothetical protein [Acinetobacter bereziniae]MCU4419599.1 hypothetical protein [Acinetobacter bereziniae]PZQ84503.1 MAG: hypothetical protein DI542_17305 [Acinetobacter johnsonii]
MANIQIHAGDFSKGKGTISANDMVFVMSTAWQAGDGFLGKSHTITRSEVEEVSLATEENVKRLGGTVGWGVAGAALLGPIGLLAGLLLGGKGKDVTFILKLKDGRKMLATTDSKTFTKIAAMAF